MTDYPRIAEYVMRTIVGMSLGIGSLQILRPIQGATMFLGIEPSAFNAHTAELLMPAVGVRTLTNGIGFLLLSFNGYRRMAGMFLTMGFVTQGVDAYLCYSCGGNWKGHLGLIPLTVGCGLLMLQ